MTRIRSSSIGRLTRSSGPSYACVQILAEAITRARSFDRDKIRDAIAATNMTTVVGPVTFRSDGTREVTSLFPAMVEGQAGIDLA